MFLSNKELGHQTSDGRRLSAVIPMWGRACKVFAFASTPATVFEHTPRSDPSQRYPQPAPTPLRRYHEALADQPAGLTGCASDSLATSVSSRTTLP